MSPMRRRSGPKDATEQKPAPSRRRVQGESRSARASETGSPVAAFRRVATRESSVPGQVGPEGGVLDAPTRTRIEGARASGTPLDSEVRSDAEALLHRDLGQVRVHAGPEADALNRRLGASAFTTGRDIFFRSDRYAPSTLHGRELLAHELTHVVQQSSGARVDPGLVGPVDDRREWAAAAVARQVASGSSVGSAESAGALQTGPSTPAGIQRAPEKIDFAPETIVNLGPGVTPTQAIDNALNHMERDIGLFWHNYQSGLQAFTNKMVFSSEQEAQSHYLNSMLKGAAKASFDLALDAFAEAAEMPEVKVIEEVVVAAVEEHERVEKAEGEVKIANFINHELLGIGDRIRKMNGAVEKQRRRLYFAYSKAAGKDRPTALGSISGPGAALISSLDRAVKAFHAKVKAANSALFQEVITERFAAMGGRYVGPITRGLYENAHLYLNAEVKHDGKSWSLESIDDEWELKTNAPEPGKIADGLKEALAEQPGHLKPYESFLTKVVRFTIQVGDWVLTSEYDDGAVVFESIDEPTFDTADAELHGRSAGEIIDAWNLVLKKKVMEITGIHGSGP